MTAQPGAPRAHFKHPSALLDLLHSGTGIREYMVINRQFHREWAPYYDDAAQYLEKWLPKVPLLDMNRRGGNEEAKVAKQIGRRLRMAQHLEMAAARQIQAAGRVYLKNWGDPSQRKVVTRGINADR